MRRDTHLPNGRATLGGLVHDAAAGANLALTMLPKAMAYAVVAGVPPIYGLYASCAAPALAIAFGSDEERGSGDEALGHRGGDRPDEEAQPGGG
jgi:sulfate permease, SulP family